MAAEGARLLGCVPAGPSDDRAVVPAAFRAGVDDEALLGDVELAAVRSVAGFLEVVGAVFERDRDVVDLGLLRDESVRPAVR